MTAKELREKRAVLAAQIKAMADKVNGENRDFSAEEKPNWETLNADYNGLTRQIEIAERAESVTGEQRAPAGDTRIGREDTQPEPEQRQPASQPSDETRSLALEAWCLEQLGRPMSDRQEAAARECRLNLRATELAIPLFRDFRQVKALREGRAIGDAAMTVTTTGGGYLIPKGFVADLEQAMLSFANMLELATVLRTATGNELPWPTVDDTSSAGEMLSINTSVTEGTVAVSQLPLKAYKGSSKMVIVPAELLQDSAFDLASYLSLALGERLGRLIAAQTTTGLGTTAPTGIVTVATAGKTTASATAITADELLDLVHSVNPAYRSAAFNCGFLMHDNIVLAVRKMKDGNGQYIWQPGLVAGQPDRLLGWPLNINQQMAGTIEAEATTVIFGALRKFIIRQVGEIRMRRLVERYAEKDQEGFVAFIRFDSNLLDAGTHPVKSLVQNS